jgi:hypothetical protein
VFVVAAATDNNPDRIPGLHLWLVANPYVTQGAGWSDIRGNGRFGTFAGFSGGVYASYNGDYFIHFDNDNVNNGFYIWMVLDEVSAQLSNLSASREATIMTVTRNSGHFWDNETLCGFWNFSPISLNTHHPYQNNEIYETFGTSVRKGPWTPPISIPGTWHIYSVSSKDGKHVGWLNGNQIGYNETNSFAVPVSCTIGKSSGTALSGYPYVYTGDFAEILIYDKYLSDYERADVESYLRNKYKSNFLSYL